VRCVCGSTDIDLYEGTPVQQAHIASLRTPPSFKEFMLGARHQARTDELRGWSEYEGPMPGPNPMSNHVEQPLTCPTCHGSGVNAKDDPGPCRACRGSGHLTPTTSELDEPQVARHNYPSTQTTTPFVGRRVQGGRTSTDPLGSVEDHVRATTPGYSPQGPQQPREPEFDWTNTSSHYPKADTHSPAMGHREPHDYDSASAAPFTMPGTMCPNCKGAAPLSLQKDHKENAWMACPTCGPLADIDSQPEIDPYRLPEDFAPAKGYRAASRKLFASRKTGRLLATLSLITDQNPGLTKREALGFARQSLRKHPEPR
jgi:hypothetical protein